MRARMVAQFSPYGKKTHLPFLGREDEFFYHTGYGRPGDRALQLSRHLRRVCGRRRKSGSRSSAVTLPSESVSHNWLYFVVVVVVDKWEAAFCFPLIHSLFSSVARRQLAIAAVLRFQSCSNCVGLT